MSSAHGKIVLNEKETEDFDKYWLANNRNNLAAEKAEAKSDERTINLYCNAIPV